MTTNDNTKSNEDLTSDIQIEIQALGINLESSLGVVKILLFGILIVGIIALIHFW